MSFKAFRIHQQEKGVRAGFEQMEVSGLTEGDVVVRVAYSGINFKDALAASGKAKILRVPDLSRHAKTHICFMKYVSSLAVGLNTRMETYSRSQHFNIGTSQIPTITRSINARSILMVTDPSAGIAPNRLKGQPE